MGQRSQIYISWENDNGEQELVARYFGWNFSERMVSRAAALMEHLSEMIDNNHFDKEKIIKISEINFDMRDVVQTSDLIEEALDFSDNSDDIHDLLYYHGLRTSLDLLAILRKITVPNHSCDCVFILVYIIEIMHEFAVIGCRC